MKLRQAMSKYNALAREFGADSEVAQFALNTIQSKVGVLGDEYKFKSGKKQGQYNVSKIERAYSDANSLVKQFEKEKEQLKRQWVKGDHSEEMKNRLSNNQIALDEAKTNRRQLKGVVELKGRNVEEALPTVRQVYVNELKEIRNADQSTLSPIEQEIAEQKGTQKAILNNPQYRQALADRANAFAEVKSQFEEVADRVYDVVVDPTTDEGRSEEGRQLWENRTNTEAWLVDALVFLGDYESFVNDKIVGKLTISSR